jgi:hypothetical protein
MILGIREEVMLKFMTWKGKRFSHRFGVEENVWVVWGKSK